MCLIVGTFWEVLKDICKINENQWSEMSPDKSVHFTPASEQPFKILTVPPKLAVVMSYKVSISLLALTLRAGAN